MGIHYIGIKKEDDDILSYEIRLRSFNISKKELIIEAINDFILQIRSDSV